jgi:hypothetical protein
MPIVRRKLDENTVYPSNIRYDPDTEQVQSLVNGVWTDNPEADPRTQTTIPARITSNTKCDAAKSVSDALKGQIDASVEATTNASTAFTIAGIILSLFTFGVFGIFISIALGIADAMIDAGGTALSAALTPAAFDTLTCILSCHFGDNGRLESDGLSGAMSDVTDQIGGLGAVIINSMLALAGEGGINNLAALGTSTGDCTGCDACPEEWCFSFDFTLSDGGWSVVSGAIGQYNAGVGWGAQTSSNYRFVEIEIEFASTEIIGIGVGSAIILDPRTATPFGDTDFVDIDGHVLSTAVLSPPPNPWLWSGDKLGATKIQVLLMCGVVTPEQAPALGEVNISSIQVRGMGECPFGTPNCD